MSDIAMRMFGAMEQSQGGKIKAGTLTDSRKEAYLDLIKVRSPYLNWEDEKKEEEAPQASLPEEEERRKFLDLYSNWANNGSPIVSSILKSQDK